METLDAPKAGKSTRRRGAQVSHGLTVSEGMSNDAPKPTATKSLANGGEQNSRSPSFALPFTEVGDEGESVRFGGGFLAYYASVLRCATVLLAAIPRAGVLCRANPHCAGARVVRFRASAFLQLTWCA